MSIIYSCCHVDDHYCGFMVFFWKHLLRFLNSFSHSCAFKSMDCTTHLPYCTASGRHLLKAIGYLDLSFVVFPIS